MPRSVELTFMGHFYTQHQPRSQLIIFTNSLKSSFPSPSRSASLKGQSKIQFQSNHLKSWSSSIIPSKMSNFDPFLNNSSASSSDSLSPYRVTTCMSFYHFPFCPVRSFQPSSVLQHQCIRYRPCRIS